jgi:hypothetical protein
MMKKETSKNGVGTMNCCGCEKPIDTTDHSLKDGIAQWYGKYVGANECIEVICHECIQDPSKKAVYSNG